MLKHVLQPKVETREHVPNTSFVALLRVLRQPQKVEGKQAKCHHIVATIAPRPSAEGNALQPPMLPLAEGQARMARVWRHLQHPKPQGVQTRSTNFP
eukprot:5117924-Amphidinium_carterae.1